MDIFESEDLANFEEGTEIKTVVPKETAKEEKEETKKPEESPVNGISEEELANMEEDEEKSHPREVKSDNEKTRTLKPEETPSSQLASLASALHEEGVLSLIDEEELANVKETKDLFELFKKEKENFKYAGLNEDQKEYLKAMENGVPHGDYAQKKSVAAQYEAVTEEHLDKNPALRQELIKRDFLVKGYSEEDAVKFTKRSVDAGEDLEDAKSATLRLKEYTKNLLATEIKEKETAKAAKAEADAKKLEALKSKIAETKEIIPGIAVNARTHEKVYNSITSPSKIKDGEPLNSFMELYSESDDFKIKVHYLMEITNGFKDFSKIEKVEKTKAIQNFEKTLEHKNTSKPSSNYSSTVSKTSKDLLEAISKSF